METHITFPDRQPTGVYGAFVSAETGTVAEPGGTELSCEREEEISWSIPFSAPLEGRWHGPWDRRDVFIAGSPSGWWVGWTAYGNLQYGSSYWKPSTEYGGVFGSSIIAGGDGLMVATLDVPVAVDEGLYPAMICVGQQGDDNYKHVLLGVVWNGSGFEALIHRYWHNSVQGGTTGSKYGYGLYTVDPAIGEPQWKYSGLPNVYGVPGYYETIPTGRVFGMADDFVLLFNVQKIPYGGQAGSSTLQDWMQGRDTNGASYTVAAPGHYRGCAVRSTDGTDRVLQVWHGSDWVRGMMCTVTPSGPSDATPPSVSMTATPRPNANGWSNSEVVVMATASDELGGSGVKEIEFTVDGTSTTTAGAEAQASVSTDGQIVVTCVARDNAGNESAPQTLTIRVDRTPPMIVGSTSPMPNSACWNNTDVTVSFECADGCSGLAATPPPVTLAAEGEGQSVAGTVEDLAGNAATVIVGGINIDKTPPQMRLPASPLKTTATSSAGAPVAFDAGANNALAGPDVFVCEPASGSTFPLGKCDVLCGATDRAGNAQSGSFVVWVAYEWSGIPQPVNADGSSVFRKGRVVPLRFRLTGPSAGIPDATAHLSYALVGEASGTINEAEWPGEGHPGNAFLYDAETDEYHFSLSTKDLEVGRYRLMVDLHDGVERSVEIQLR